MKWLVRSLIGLSALALILFMCASWYLWSLGADTIARGKVAGWVALADNAPLTVFEQTAAKALFADTWNRTGFPCRTVQDHATGGVRTSAPISYFVARDMIMDVDPERSLQAGLKVISAACQLEITYTDTALLRLWVARFRLRRFGNLDAASRELLGSPLPGLNHIEAARMVALLQSPGDWQRPEQWAKRSEHVLKKAQSHRWVGETIEPVSGVTQ